MIATFTLTVVVLSYSGWMLYKHIRNKIIGKCDEVCSGCSLNGFCPTQQLEKKQIDTLILDKKLIK